MTVAIIAMHTVAAPVKFFGETLKTSIIVQIANQWPYSVAPIERIQSGIQLVWTMHSVEIPMKTMARVSLIIFAALLSGFFTGSGA